MDKKKKNNTGVKTKMPKFNIYWMYAILLAFLA